MRLVVLTFLASCSLAEPSMLLSPLLTWETWGAAPRTWAQVTGQVNRQVTDRSQARSQVRLPAGQRPGHRSGQRSGHRSGHRPGQPSGHRSGHKSGHRSGHRPQVTGYRSQVSSGVIAQVRSYMSQVGVTCSTTGSVAQLVNSFSGINELWQLKSGTPSTFIVKCYKTVFWLSKT